MSSSHKIQGVSSNNGIFWNLLASNNNNLYHFGYFFKYPFNIGDTIDYINISGEGIQVTLIEDTCSLQIGNKKFINSVIRIRSFDEIKPHNKRREYIWISKDAGIIKIQYFFGAYWELIDYKINK